VEHYTVAAGGNDREVEEAGLSVDRSEKRRPCHGGPLSAGQLRIPEPFVGRDVDAKSLAVQGNPLIPQMASSFSAQFTVAACPAESQSARVHLRQ
jgi:hypothetical protein